MSEYETQGAHTEEFLAEEPVVIEREDLDLDGYVDADGHPAKHQSPAEVAREKDVQAELDAQLFEIPEREA
ncbi:MAG: hypothetical protein JWM80_2222 [Cyanobacteria bacterium RYN_339]|nr:hypothetical protein [Cyanobacteria bacterium RYN_339]